MTLPLAKSIELQRQLRQSLMANVRTTIELGQTQTAMLKARSAILATIPKDAPKWLYSQSMAYWDGVADSLIRRWRPGCGPGALIFGYWIEGEFYSTDSNHHAYYDRRWSPSEFSSLTKDMEGHFYWESDPTKIFY